MPSASSNRPTIWPCALWREVPRTGQPSEGPSRRYGGGTHGMSGGRGAPVDSSERGPADVLLRAVHVADRAVEFDLRVGDQLLGIPHPVAAVGARCPLDLGRHVVQFGPELV